MNGAMGEYSKEEYYPEQAGWYPLGYQPVGFYPAAYQPLFWQTLVAGLADVALLMIVGSQALSAAKKAFKGGEERQ